MSDAAVSYAFEQLEPTAPPPRDAGARILAQAAAEAERIREAARAEGFAAGQAAGREHGAAEIAAAVAALEHALRGMREQHEHSLAQLERDAVELALALAAKILAGALQARRELVVEVVQGALRRIADRRRITVLVNPADVERVQAAIGQIASQGSGVELCEVLAEERVPVASAIVRTAEGEVDASVHTQLERAREVVATALQSREPDEPGEAPQPDPGALPASAGDGKDDR